MFAGRVEGLPRGLYHYNVAGHALELVAEDDWGPVLSLNVHAPPVAWNAPVVFLVTGVRARSAWKYRDRAYRYVCLDAGHLLGNLMLMAAGYGLASYLLLNFADQAVNNLLDVNDREEFALALLPVGRPSEEPTEPFSYGAYPVGPAWGGDLLGEAHHTGSLGLCSHGKKLHFQFREASPSPAARDEKAFHPDRVLARRRSVRQYSTQILSRTEFVRLIEFERSFFRGNFTDVPAQFELYAVVHKVSDLVPGLYRIEDDGGVELVSSGHLTAALARASIWQDFVRNSNVQFVVTANLRKIFGTLGVRAYRHVLIQAGVAGEGLYIGAAESGLGACGVGAFFDGEIASLLGMEKKGQSVLYYLSVGKT